MFANTDHALDSTLAPATNAAGLAPPSSASGSATVGSGGGLLGGTAGTGAAQMPLAPSIYQLQGRNPDLTIATTGNAKKSIVSTLNEKTDEKGVTQHEYYHTSKLQRDGTVLDEGKFWFTESPKITNGIELNRRLQTRWCQVKEQAPARAKSTQVQHGFAAGEGIFDAMIELGKQGKATMKEGAEDAAELNTLVGGDGMKARVPAVDEMRSLSGVCDICSNTKTSGIQVMSCCKDFKVCLGCILKIADGKCPHCRTPLPMPPGAPDSSSDDDGSLDRYCFGCNQPAPRLDRAVCDVADCPKWICVGCNKTTITSAMINDTSTHFCCPDHHNHATLGYIKLEAYTRTISVPTTASDRAARGARRSGTDWNSPTAPQRPAAVAANSAIAASVAQQPATTPVSGGIASGKHAQRCGAKSKTKFKSMVRPAKTGKHAQMLALSLRELPKHNLHQLMRRNDIKPMKYPGGGSASIERLARLLVSPV